MKNISIILTLIALTTFSASAEVRLLNWTGRDLKVDVLHKSGPVRDVNLPKGKTVSEPIGPKTSFRTSEMLVVKSADGKELLRQSIQSQNLYTIEKRAGSYYLVHTSFYNGPARHATLKVMNATGQKLAYQYETPDFQLKKNKLDSGTLRAWNIGNENSYEIGDSMNVKLGMDTPSQAFDFKAGSVYLITNENGTLKATEMGKD